MSDIFATALAVDLLRTLADLGVAIVLGTLIGAERQYRQRNAGLRTNSLVAVGAAAFVHLGSAMAGSQGSVQIVAYVVSGIGFLGAGVILKDGTNIRGLNTAATLWCSAAVGAFAGTGRAVEAGLLALFVLAGNTFLRPLVNLINRAPIDERASEATYQVHATVRADRQDDVRDTMIERLEAANYPVREIEAVERKPDKVELVATLASTSVDPDELDAVVTELDSLDTILYATWTSSTAD
jgi:putative Mg2+ transporter-C (MgtC) family protein